MKERILVFIPMYNCRRQISRVIAQFDERARSFVDEVLILDNGSSDGSREAAAEAIQGLSIKASVRQNAENYNLGGSHKAAFNYALEHKFDYVIVLHGDDQGAIEDILPLLQERKHEGLDSLLGARFMSASRLVGYSKLRIYGNILLNAFISVMSGAKVYDLGSGLNLYSTDFLKNNFYLGFPNDLTFNVYMLLYSIWTKSRFGFFPLSWREDDQVSNAKVFRQGLHILGLSLKYMFFAQKLFKNLAMNSSGQYLSSFVSGNAGAADQDSAGGGHD